MKALLGLLLVATLAGCGGRETAVGAWGGTDGPVFALFPDGTVEFHGYSKPAVWRLEGARLIIEGSSIKGGRVNFRDGGEVMTIASDAGLSVLNRYDLPEKGKWTSEYAAKMQEIEKRQEARKDYEEDGPDDPVKDLKEWGADVENRNR